MEERKYSFFIEKLSRLLQKKRGLVQDLKSLLERFYSLFRISFMFQKGKVLTKPEKG